MEIIVITFTIEARRRLIPVIHKTKEWYKIKTKKCNDNVLIYSVQNLIIYSSKNYIFGNIQKLYI